MTTTEVVSPLARIVHDTGLAGSKGELVLATLGPLAEQAADLIEKSRGITVTDATQVSEMKAARTARLALKDVRVAAEKARKELKADALNIGRAIDLCGNFLKGECEKEEARLLESEEFAARKEAERKAATKKAREDILRPFGIDLSFYNLADMPEATFTELHESTRLSAEARKAAAVKAEADRIAAEKARADEDARIRAENDRLAREAREKEAALKSERERVAREAAATAAREKAARDAIESKARAEREAADEAARKERLAIQAKADEDRRKAEAKAKVERDAAAKKLRDAEAARKRVEDASADLFLHLRQIARVLLAGETVTIEPGSGQADGIIAAIAKAEGGVA